MKDKTVSILAQNIEYLKGSKKTYYNLDRRFTLESFTISSTSHQRFSSENGGSIQYF